MTAVVTQVSSVHFDERPHEWRSVHDPRGYAQLIDDIVAPPPAGSPPWVHGHRMIIVGEHPYDPAATGPTPMLLAAVGPDSGAVYYREYDHGTVSGWIADNPTPIAHPREFAFSSQGWNTFPASAVLTTSQLRAVVDEYLHTGHRPTGIPWQASEMVQ